MIRNATGIGNTLAGMLLAAALASKLQRLQPPRDAAP